MESVDKLKVEKCVSLGMPYGVEVPDDVKIYQNIAHSYEGDGIPIKPETTTIEHAKWGRVDGVDRIGHVWAKNGALYQPEWGWREVKPKRLEPVPIDLSIEAGRHVLRCDRSCFILPQGYRWERVVIKKEVES